MRTSSGEDSECAAYHSACSHLDVLKEDASSSLVLEGQQLLSMLPLLMAVLLEETGKAWKRHIITGEVESLSDGVSQEKKQ